MASFEENLEGKLAKIWSIRTELLQVIPVGHWISCLKLCVVQNSLYLLGSADVNFV